MKVLIVLNEPAYGNERSHNSLRLARDLMKREVSSCVSSSWAMR